MDTIPILYSRSQACRKLGCDSRTLAKRLGILAIEPQAITVTGNPLYDDSVLHRLEAFDLKQSEAKL